MNPFYQAANNISQYVRRKNYKLYRSIVENRLFYSLIVKTFQKKSVHITTPEGHTLYLNPLYHGQFMPEGAVQSYEQTLRRALEMIVQPGMTVYDIGANVGIFSLFLISKIGSNGHVIAFEPEENNLRCLNETKTFNRVEQLTVEDCCVTDSSGTELFDHRGGAFSGRVIDKNDVQNNHTVSQKRSVTLDDYVTEHADARPDIVKIDVEGNEGKVIKGMSGTLKTHRPIIVCELHKELCDDIPEIYRILSDHDYVCYDIDDFANERNNVLESFDRAHHIIAQKEGS